MRSGEPTNGALIAKLRLCKKLMILTSANGAGHKNGKSGSIAIATLIAGTRIPVNGEVATGPFMNLEKEAGRVMSGKKRVSITALRASTEEAAKAARRAVKEVAKKVVASEL